MAAFVFAPSRNSPVFHDLPTDRRRPHTAPASRFNAPMRPPHHLVVTAATLQCDTSQDLNTPRPAASEISDLKFQIPKPAPFGVLPRIGNLAKTLFQRLESRFRSRTGTKTLSGAGKVSGGVGPGRGGRKAVGGGAKRNHRRHQGEIEILFRVACAAAGIHPFSPQMCS